MGCCAVEKRSTKLLSDGFGELVIWSDDDVLVVPRDIEGGYSRNNQDAVCISFALDSMNIVGRTILQQREIEQGFF
jgi:hypothetical protein